jgi:hypothetical protein
MIELACVMGSPVMALAVIGGEMRSLTPTPENILKAPTRVRLLDADARCRVLACGSRVRVLDADARCRVLTCGSRVRVLEAGTD